MVPELKHENTEEPVFSGPKFFFGRGENNIFIFSFWNEVSFWVRARASDGRESPDAESDFQWDHPNL